MEFHGFAAIVWLENGHQNVYQCRGNDDFHNKLKQITETIPKAHVAWIMVNWETKEVQAARGEMDG